jgi:hypothetical protein
MQQSSAQRPDLIVCCADTLQEATAYLYCEGSDPGTSGFQSRLLLFLLGCLCLFCLLRFLGHLPLRVPQVWLNASQHSACIRSAYTTIAKLIPLASKKVNERARLRDNPALVQLGDCGFVVAGFT